MVKYFVRYLVNRHTDTQTHRQTHTQTDAHEHRNNPRPAELAGFNKDRERRGTDVYIAAGRGQAKIGRRENKKKTAWGQCREKRERAKGVYRQ